MSQEEELRILQERSARTGLRTADVEQEKKEIRNRYRPEPAPQVQTQPPDERTSRLTKEQDVIVSRINKREEDLRKELLFRREEQAKLKQDIAKVERGEATAQELGYKNISRLRKRLSDSYKWEGYARENTNDRNEKDRLRVRAYERALERGTNPSHELKYLRSRNRERSTEEILQERAQAGDEDAQAKLNAKRIWLGKANIKTRTVGSNNKPTLGKKSGVYVSPLTGKAVIVKEGSKDNLKFVNKPAQNLYTRPYVVNATVRGEEYKGNAPSSTSKKSPSETFVATPTPDGNKLPLGEYGTNISVAPEQTTTTYNYDFGEQKNFLVVDEKPERMSSYYFLRQAQTKDKEAGELKYGNIKNFYVNRVKSSYYKTLSVATGVFEPVAPLVESSVEGYKQSFSFAREPSKEKFKELQAQGRDTQEEFLNFATAPVSFAVAVATKPFGTVQSIKQDFSINPYGTAGQFAPAVLGGVEALRYGAGKLRAVELTQATKGKVATPELISEVPSTLFRVDPLEQVTLTQATQSGQFGGIRYSTSRPVYSETQFVTASELSKAPSSYDAVVSLSQAERVRPAYSGRTAGIETAEGSFSSSSFNGKTSFSKTTVKPQDVNVLTEPTFQKSFFTEEGTAGFTRESVARADIKFIEGDRSVGFPKGESSRTGTTKNKPFFIEESPLRVDYTPSIDFWEGVLVQTPETALYFETSFATGRTRGGRCYSSANYKER